MSDAHPGIRAIVAGHGDFAQGVISAVDQITGRGSIFMPMSNTNLCAADIQQVLLDNLRTTGARVVFTDLPAGSCTMAVRRILRELPDVMLVTGSNVPMLLDFAMHDDASDPVEAACEAVERAHAAIMVHKPGT